MGKIRIFLAGDFCSKPSTSRITVSEELKSLIRSCQLRAVNFEVPLKPSASLPQQRRERFFQNDDAPDFLRSLGFNLFSMANNHAFDWGDEGFRKTKVALGDAAFGAGSYDEAYRVKVVEVEGVKIGFFALSFAAYKGVFDDVTRRDRLGCAYINDLRVNHDIMEAKKHIDYLFVLPHDGIEYIDIPMPETVARYRDFIDYGADGVIAAHPHCPQGWEEYQGKPIFYSLGNFLFNSKPIYDFHAKKPHWYEGLCVVLTIDNGEISWEVVNTRNVNNTGIEIDHDVARKQHDDKLCRYLTDRDAYQHCLKRTVTRLGYGAGMKVVWKSVVKYWIEKISKNHSTNDNELAYLMKNNLRSSLVIRAFEL